MSRARLVDSSLFPSQEDLSVTDTVSPIGLGVSLFNSSPVEGVGYFRAGTAGGAHTTDAAIANILCTDHSVDRQQLVAYLCIPGESDGVLLAVVDNLPLTSREVDMALRQLFHVIAIPSEYGRKMGVTLSDVGLRRLLTAFAAKYHATHRSHIFGGEAGILALGSLLVEFNTGVTDSAEVATWILSRWPDDSDARDAVSDMCEAVRSDPLSERDSDPFPDSLHRRWVSVRHKGNFRRRWMILDSEEILVQKSSTSLAVRRRVMYSAISDVVLANGKKAGFTIHADEDVSVSVAVKSDFLAKEWSTKILCLAAQAKAKLVDLQLKGVAIEAALVQQLRGLWAPGKVVDVETVRPLLEKLKGSPRLDNILHIPIMRRDNVLLKEMLKNTSVNPRYTGIPPVGIAARIGNPEALQILLEAGADATIQWQDRNRVWTPLLVACYECRLKCVSVLLTSGQLSDLDVNFMVERDWLKEKRECKNVVNRRALLKASSRVLLKLSRQQTMSSLPSAEELVENMPEDEAEEEEEEETTWMTILDISQDKIIREELIRFGGRPAVGVLDGLLDQRTRKTMDRFCRNLAHLRGSPRPVIFIPGYCSSVMECWSSTRRPDWAAAKLWVAIGLMTSAAMKSGATNDWLEHMLLKDDWSDPDGICVRPAQGLHAVDYLASGVGRDMSYVLGHVIRAFMASGYTPKNLAAFSYDWRLSPRLLEERDAAFTLLRCQVEGFVRANGKRVVLIGHSMGNKFIHYFLFWAEKTLSREWIDSHIRLFVAMGAPWSGAAKTIRGLHTGDAVGLEMLLSYPQVVDMSRSHASLGWLMPCSEDMWKRVGLESSMFVSNGQRGPQPIALSKMMHQSPKFEKLGRSYNRDELYGAKQNGQTEITSLRAPPVQELLCIHGKNLPTEVAIMFKSLKKPQATAHGEEIRLKLDTSKKHAKALIGNKKGLRFKNGLILEVPDDDESIFSGDGTVPYASLTHYKQWIDKPGAPKIRSVVFDEAEHRSMLSMPEVIGALLSRLTML